MVRCTGLNVGCAEANQRVLDRAGNSGGGGNSGESCDLARVLIDSEPLLGPFQALSRLIFTDFY